MVTQLEILSVTFYLCILSDILCCMNTLEIYKKYPITENLKTHQIRAASVGAYLCDTWKKEGMVDKDLVIKALLTHDMGNIVKYDLSNPEFLTPEEKEQIDYWYKQQKIFTEKYNDEHTATQEIVKELGLGDDVLNLQDSAGSSKLQKALHSQNWNLKIVSYSDLRCAPYGIVSINERFDDIIARYKNRNHALSDENRVENLRKLCLELEQQLMEQVTIRPDDITDAVIDSYRIPLAEYTF